MDNSILFKMQKYRPYRFCFPGTVVLKHQCVSGSLESLLKPTLSGPTWKASDFISLRRRLRFCNFNTSRVILLLLSRGQHVICKDSESECLTGSAYSTCSVLITLYCLILFSGNGLPPKYIWICNSSFDDSCSVFTIPHHLPHLQLPIKPPLHLVHPLPLASQYEVSFSNIKLALLTQAQLVSISSIFIYKIETVTGLPEKMMV